jgi:hypothetical protein
MRSTILDVTEPDPVDARASTEAHTEHAGFALRI